MVTDHHDDQCRVSNSADGALKLVSLLPTAAYAHHCVTCDNDSNLLFFALSLDLSGQKLHRPFPL